MAQMDELIADIVECDNRFENVENFKNKYTATILQILNSVDCSQPRDQAKVDELMLACLRCGYYPVMECVAETILGRKQLIDWKSRPDFVNKCLTTVLQTADQPAKTRIYDSFLDKFVKLLKTLQVFDIHVDDIFKIIEKSMLTVDQPNGSIHSAALGCIRAFDFTSQPQIVHQIVRLMKKVVQQNPDMYEDQYQCATATVLMSMSLQSADLSTRELILDDISDLFNHCAGQEWRYHGDPSRRTMAHAVCLSVLDCYFQQGVVGPQLMKPMLKSIKELSECYDDVLQPAATRVLTNAAAEPALGNEDNTGELIEQFIDGKLPRMTASLINIYKQRPQDVTPLLPRFRKMLQTAADSQVAETMITVQLIAEIAKDSPELITDETVEVIAKLLDNNNHRYMTLTFFDSLASSRPSDVLPYEDKLLSIMRADNNASSLVSGVLVKLAADDPSRQRRYLAECAAACRTTPLDVYKLSLLSNMRSIGQRCPQLLAEHRSMIEEFLQIAELNAMSQYTLEVIEGIESAAPPSESPPAQDESTDAQPDVEDVESNPQPTDDLSSTTPSVNNPSFADQRDNVKSEEEGDKGTVSVTPMPGGSTREDASPPSRPSTARDSRQTSSPSRPGTSKESRKSSTNWQANNNDKPPSKSCILL